jgi:hypothetical protein
MSETASKAIAIQNKREASTQRNFSEETTSLTCMTSNTADLLNFD